MKLIRKVLMEVFGKDWLKVYERWLKRSEEGVGVKSQLIARLKKSDGREYDFGVIGDKIITNTGITEIGRALTGARPSDGTINQHRWAVAYRHAVGTGTNPESATDTALQNMVAGWVNASSYNFSFDTTTRILEITSTGSFSFTTSYNITEHGVRSREAASGVDTALFDRFVFADRPIPVSNGDSLNMIYRLRFQF